jgi:heme oxygenase (mycobilin-producing)
MAAITLINSFEVPAEREDQFLQFWKQVNAYMQKKPGYLSHKLHRAITPGAVFRFVNVARWSSLAQYQAAHDAGFRELVDDPAGSAFKPHPFVYEVIHEAHAEPGSIVA